MEDRDENGKYPPTTVSGEIVNPSPEVAWRDDEVGRLARAACGLLDEAVPPDPTAVPPLIDALLGAGRYHEAADMSRWLVNIATQYNVVYGPSRHPDVSTFAENWSRMFASDWGHLTRDLYSAANLLAARVTNSLKPVEQPAVVEGQVTTVRISLAPPYNRVGRHITLPDGDRGLVVALHADGTCEVVRLGEEEPDDEVGPRSLSLRPSPQHRAAIRRLATLLPPRPDGG